MTTHNKLVAGFVGVGVMGRHMVRNLAEAGMVVQVFDVVPEALEALPRHDNIRLATSLPDALSGADIVITMLPDTPHVEAVVFGEGGIVATLPSGSLFVDMSTISAHTTRVLAEKLSERRITMLDAPVSGGPVGAENGTLSIMVGGDADGFARAYPFFKAMGETITHVGAAGAGQTVKLCNQLICGINIQAICEALALGRACGVNLEQMRDVLLGGSAASWMLDRLGTQMISGDASAGFRIDLMFKDLRLVMETAMQANVPLPATALVTSQYIDARAHGEGGNGNQALFKVYDRMTAQDRERSHGAGA